MPLITTSQYSTIDTSFTLLNINHLNTSVKLEQNGQPSSLFFRNDGAKVYMSGTGASASEDEQNEYTLSTPWDISSMSLSSSIPLHQAGVIEDVFTGVGVTLSFKPDGSRMYVCGSLIPNNSNNYMFEYSLT